MRRAVAALAILAASCGASDRRPVDHAILIPSIGASRGPASAIPPWTTAPTTTSTTSTPPPPTTRPRAGRSSTGRPVDLGYFTATCYALPPKGTRGGPGSIAVDPHVIALGTPLTVEGYGDGAARDTGGDIKGQRIDVWLSTTAACLDWGRRRVRVWSR